jgi:hypothetical protein
VREDVRSQAVGAARSPPLSHSRCSPNRVLSLANPQFGLGSYRHVPGVVWANCGRWNRPGLVHGCGPPISAVASKSVPGTVARVVLAVMEYVDAASIALFSACMYGAINCRSGSEATVGAQWLSYPS